MTVPKTIADLYSSVVMCYDFEQVYSSGGVRYLKDAGPSGFDMAFPGGAADPTIGDGFFSYSGAQYLSLPAGQLARFYSKMPVGQYAFLMTHSIRGGYLFSCFSAILGNNFGMALGPRESTFAHYNLVGTAAAPSVVVAVTPDVYPTSVAFTVESTPKAIRQSAIRTVSWTVGAYAGCVYDTTAIPRISGHPSGAFPLSAGSLVYYLCLLDTNGWSLDYATMSVLSKLLRDGKKPFTGRAL